MKPSPAAFDERRGSPRRSRGPGGGGGARDAAWLRGRARLGRRLPPAPGRCAVSDAARTAVTSVQHELKPGAPQLPRTRAPGGPWGLGLRRIPGPAPRRSALPPRRRGGAPARQARFPDIKTLDLLTGRRLGASRGHNSPSSPRVERGEDVVIAGPIGTARPTSRSLSAEAAPPPVAFVTADLASSWSKPGRASSRGCTRSLQRVALLVVDELGFVPFERTVQRAVVQPPRRPLRAALHVVTTNLAFSDGCRSRRRRSSLRGSTPRASRSHPHHARRVLPHAARSPRARRRGAEHVRRSIVRRNQIALRVAWPDRSTGLDVDRSQHGNADEVRRRARRQRGASRRHRRGLRGARPRAAAVGARDARRHRARVPSALRTCAPARA